MANPFEILQVKPEDHDDTIRQAYLDQIRRYTPDGCPERFQQIRQAYELIQTRKARLAYTLFTLDDEQESRSWNEWATVSEPRRLNEALLTDWLLDTLSGKD